jgi:hypothetical protein
MVPVLIFQLKTPFYSPLQGGLSAFIRVYWWFKKKETGGLDGNAELLN